MNQSDCDKICYYLGQTYAAKTPALQKEAEDELQKMSKNDDYSFLMNMGKVIMNPNVIENIKLAASTYSHRIIRNMFFMSHVTNFGAEVKVNVSQMLFDILVSKNVTLKIKKNIEECFGYFLGEDNDNLLKPKILHQIKSTLSSSDLFILQGSLLSLMSLLKAISQISGLKELYTEVMDGMINFGRKMLEEGRRGGIRMKEGWEEENLGKAADAEEEIKQRMSLLSIWSEIVEHLIYKLSDPRSDSLKLILSNEDLCALFFEIIFFQIETPLQIKNSILWTGKLTDLNKIVNETKVNLFRSYVKLLSYINESSLDLNYNLSKYFLALKEFVPELIESLKTICNDQQSLDLILQPTEAEALLVECLDLLGKCALNQEFYQIFSVWKKTLVVDVIMNLLVTSSAEFELFESSPEEFVCLALDTCDKQQSETYKTAAAQLLEIICDNLDGTLTQIAYLLFNILRYSIESNNQQDIPIKYSVLSEIQNCRFMAVFSAEQRIETSLLMLTVISYLMPKRRDLIKIIQDILILNNHFFINSSPIIKVRLLIFLAYYLDTLFLPKDLEDFLKLYLQFTIDCIHLLPTSPCLAYQALDTLSTILADEDSIIRVSPYIKELFPYLFSLISGIQDEKFINMIEQIIKNYGGFLTDYPSLCELLFKEIVKRIFLEVERNNQLTQNMEKKNKTNLCIIKCWNLLREISTNKYLIPKYAELFEQELSPLLEQMKSGDLRFDNDIICLLCSILKNTKVVTKRMIDLMGSFGTYFEKHEGYMGPLFKCLNYMVYYGTELFNNNSNLINMLIIMGTSSLISQSKLSSESSQSDGALLLHLIIQRLAPSLGKEDLIRIYDFSLNRLSKEIKHDFLIARILEVFLNGFIFTFDLTQEILEQRGVLQMLIGKMLERLEIYQYSYDKKIFVNAFCSVLLKNNISERITVRIIPIFESLITLLKIQQISESNEKEKFKLNENEDIPEIKNNIGVKKMKDDFEDEEDEDDYFDDDEDDEEKEEDDNEELDFSKENEEYEAKEHIARYLSDILEHDEYENFKKVIYFLRDKDQNGLLVMVSKIKEVTREFLNQVMLSQRIVLKGEGGAKSVPRKIVKVKGKKKGGII